MSIRYLTVSLAAIAGGTITDVKINDEKRPEWNKKTWSQLLEHLGSEGWELKFVTEILGGYKILIFQARP